MNCYEERRRRMYEWMAVEGIDLAVFEDSERARNPGLRYLSGHPNDALLVLSARDRKALLLPWDVNMAGRYANVEAILPYTGFELNPVKALSGALDYFKITGAARVELPASTTYPRFLEYTEALGGTALVCRDDGAEAAVSALRAVKDEAEIALYGEAANVTNELIGLIEKNVRDGSLKTEADVAVFIETECRKRGCDGTGFGTLAAGPERSFGIHCFPGYTGGAFAGPGLSILDFGLIWQGYTSDVTLTFAKALSKEQEAMLGLVEEAFVLAYGMVKDGAGEKTGSDTGVRHGGQTPVSDPASAGESGGISAREVALAVDGFFAAAGRQMPHGLGHGIGLEAHEGPYLRCRADNAWRLRASMVFTLEPGLYDPALGGCRLENDILLRDHDAVILTKSKIIRL
jgi:Xaa-Pro dipeptidase